MKVISIAAVIALASSASAFVPAVAPQRAWCVSTPRWGFCGVKKLDGVCTYKKWSDTQWPPLASLLSVGLLPYWSADRPTCWINQIIMNMILNGGKLQYTSSASNAVWNCARIMDVNIPLAKTDGSDYDRLYCCGAITWHVIYWREFKCGEYWLWSGRGISCVF